MPLYDRIYLPEDIRGVIGRGLKFPFEFSPGTGGLSGLTETDGVDKVQEAIRMILSTYPGERFFEVEYGSELPKQVFEPLDEGTKELLKFWTAGAVSRWEPRVEVLDVQILEDDARLDNNTVGIVVSYRIKGSDKAASFVYPFEVGPGPDLRRSGWFVRY